MRKSSIYLLSLALVISLVLGDPAATGEMQQVTAVEEVPLVEAAAPAPMLWNWSFGPSSELHQKYFRAWLTVGMRKIPIGRSSSSVLRFRMKTCTTSCWSHCNREPGRLIFQMSRSVSLPILERETQLVPYNDIVEPHKDKIVQSRLDIYAKDGQYYGLPYHVGASVIYYNMEILEQAGVNPEDIKTSDDFKEAGRRSSRRRAFR